MATQSPPKQPKVRSAQFPGYSLADAIKLAAAVETLGGTASSDAVGQAMDPKRSLDSGPGKRLIAAAGYYGLIKREGRQIEILDRGRKAVLGQGDEQRQALSEAFLSPKLFAALFSRFRGKDLPATDALVKLLRYDHALAEGGARQAMKVFVGSGLSAGVLEKKNGTYSCRDVEVAPPPEEPVEEDVGQAEKGIDEGDRGSQPRTKSRVTIQINLDVSGWTPQQVAELVRLLEQPD